MGIQDPVTCYGHRAKNSSRFLQNVRIRCRASSPFHNLLCSSRICRFRITSRIRANPSRNTKCQPIQLSKILVSGSSELPHSR